MTGRRFTPQRFPRNNRHNSAQAVHSYLYGLRWVNATPSRGYFSQPAKQFKLDFDRWDRRVILFTRLRTQLNGSYGFCLTSDRCQTRRHSCTSTRLCERYFLKSPIESISCRKSISFLHSASMGVCENVLSSLKTV